MRGHGRDTKKEPDLVYVSKYHFVKGIAKEQKVKDICEKTGGRAGKKGWQLSLKREGEI